ncbi:cyclic peptide export ABC transporter [Xanthomonas sacchari]|uniref:cyclic peptide export ABC transporter n=1 Tax=Xanthomonas sacchari TaxID=56458 RepID=UPI002253A37F|nr:cyclic peptide export ABC transporter [Xanthomonas sacchari]UYK86706.1 cyclic peptide export ABC transporter [Xanthomonas sacchari]
MNLFSEFSARAPNRVFASVVLGGLSGASYSLLIPLVLSVISDEDARFERVVEHAPHFLGLEIAHAPFAAIFALTCLFILVARSLSQIMLTRLSIDVASDLRARMYERIVRAPLPALERIGEARLIAALTTDIPRIVNGARVMPDLMIDTIVTLGMLGFLLVLNVDVFFFVIACIFFGILTYQIPMLLAQRRFVSARRAYDQLQQSMNGLIHGIKELKLSDAKQRDFFESVLMSHERNVCGGEKAGHTLFRAAGTYGDLLSFFVIGCIMFVFVNYRLISNAELTGVVMALLYLTGPVAMILANLPLLSFARVSLQRFSALSAEIPEEEVGVSTTAMPIRHGIRFEGVVYRHVGEANERHFQVGPIDLELRLGEITFIVGGNGSGKSTLSKLMTLHYRASDGRIMVDGAALAESGVGALRQSICAIYSDYYLFDRVLGRAGETEAVAPLVEHYLRMLGLEGKVQYREGRFSTLALSDGQRRRLALLAAILDDCTLYLFDEWAADQDPEFKAVFYREVIPALKRRNKAIVVISHDDRYFDVADQLVTLEEGAIARIDRAKPAGTASPATGQGFSLCRVESESPRQSAASSTE